jgi:prefoldin subunit 5
MLIAAGVATSALFGADAPPAAPPPLAIHGTLDAVTVYRGQALVSRLVEVPGPAGLKEVTITGLPDQILPGSLYAESADSAEVQSVDYSAHPVEKDVRADVQKFDDQMRELQDQVAGLQQHRQLLEAQRDTLAKVNAFTTATSTTDLNRGVLNADTLQKMVQFDFDQRNRILDEQLKLDLDIRGKNEQIQTLQRQRAQVATSSSKIAREAKILVNLAGNGGKVRVRYLVDNATWFPSYNLRVDAQPAREGERKATLEYLASIQQMSGEDWTNVQMTLSTATASLVAKAPLLNELAISLATPGRADMTDLVQKLEQSGSEAAREELRQQRTQVEQFRANMGANYNAIASPLSAANNYTINGTVVNLDYIGDNNDVDLLLNRTAADLQLVDLAARDKVVRVKEIKPSKMDNEMAITYQLQNHTSLLSRSDRQLIRIANIPLKPKFYKVAQPVLNDYVYDEALAVNDSPYVLLYGDMQTYVANQFVGRGVLPSTSIGQSLEVGLGIDSSLRAHRVLVEKTEGISGGNRVADFTYRLLIENFGNAPAKVQLYDRLPTTKDTSKEITVSTGTSAKGSADKELSAKEPLDKATSQDPLYLQKDKKKNILRWDLEVPQNSVDEKAYAVEYQFTLLYDKNLTIVEPAPVPVATTQPNANAVFTPMQRATQSNGQMNSSFGNGAGGAGGGGFGGARGGGGGGR